MFCVYVLWSRSAGRSYVGSTQDISDRLRRHNSGVSKATAHGAPWELVHSESFLTRSEATLRERNYKTGKGRDELRPVIEKFLSSDGWRAAGPANLRA
jgi:putative endonuclease